MTEAIISADERLAARVEGVAAQQARVFAATAIAQGESDAAVIDVAGGAVLHLSQDSPVNGAVGMGFEGTFTHEHAETIERFFLERDAHPCVSLCPLAHASMTEVLAQRGWVVDGFENVLVRLLDDLPDLRLASGITVEEALTEEARATWALVAANGFSAPLDPLPEQIRVGSIAAAKPDSRLFLARVDGNVAATGELSTAHDIAWLSADSTLSRYRGRGCQQTLQRYRLHEGVRAGCTLAVSESVPGSGSQRNMERLGFRVAYTRVEMTLPAR